MSKDTYRTLKKASEGLFKDRGSKFISFAFPIQSEEEVKEHLKRIKKEFHSARHHCYAFRIGTDTYSFRTNDDGEPSGTAGKPIFGQILSQELTNILIVVVRYFGGTLLGTSGLINAYRSSSSNCLESAEIVELTIEKEFSIDFKYEQMNLVMRVIKDEGLVIRNRDFQEICKMQLTIRKSVFGRVKERLEKVPELKFEY